MITWAHCQSSHWHYWGPYSTWLLFFWYSPTPTLEDAFISAGPVPYLSQEVYTDTDMALHCILSRDFFVTLGCGFWSLVCYYLIPPFVFFLFFSVISLTSTRAALGNGQLMYRRGLLAFLPRLLFDSGLLMSLRDICVGVCGVCTGLLCLLPRFAWCCGSVAIFP